MAQIVRKIIDFGQHGKVALLYVPKVLLSDWLEANDGFEEVCEAGWWWCFVQDDEECGIKYLTDYFGPYGTNADALECFVDNAVEVAVDKALASDPITH